MFRIALGIEYDGSNYHGWQRQKNNILPTIQQQLELAVSYVANHPVSTICAGRTDAKVHATHQVVHFDTTANRKTEAWVFGVNRYLPPDIRVIWSKEMNFTFNARKSAIYRTYNYYIYNSKVKTGLYRNYVAWQYKSLDLSKIQEASNFWLGEHDFSSFRAKDCQSKTPVRKVNSITVSKQNELLKITIKANAFLHHMVRNMVGVLIEIGQGNYQPFWAKEVLLAKNRSEASITAPPEGLYLVDVGYLEQFKLPKITRGFNFL